MSEPIKTIGLKNGLLLRFFDLSNRYYGDFHRVCVQLTAEIPLTRLTIPADLLAQKSSLPETICWTKRLQRMGVKTADLDRIRQALINDFIRTALPYLARPGFPDHLLRENMTGKPRRFKAAPAGD